MSPAPFIDVKNLRRVFDVSKPWLNRVLEGGHLEFLKAVDGVTFDIKKGETFALVGESGSGKTTVARMVVGLLPPSSGEVVIDGVSMTDARQAQVRQKLRRRIQMIFQDPYASLNPRRTVGAAISEGPLNFGATRAAAWQRAAELMELVKLSPGSLHRYPHEFSGGQRQRICIARALAMEPELLIADEAVSALDVSVQKQVLELLDEIRVRLNLAVLFITHDLRVAAQICDYVAVMSKGRVVEYGSAEQVFGAPKDDYTKALFAAAPGRNWQFGKFAA